MHLIIAVTEEPADVTEATTHHLTTALPDYVSDKTVFIAALSAALEVLAKSAADEAAKGGN